MSIEISTIFRVVNDGKGASKFGVKEIELEGEPLRRLSKQQPAENFRLRSSSPDYASDWHVAGDPTLLVILTGAVEIELRNGATKVFREGEMFIAEDFLPEKERFTQDHGHRARVVGNEILCVLHLKLEKRY